MRPECRLRGGTRAHWGCPGDPPLPLAQECRVTHCSFHNFFSYVLRHRVVQMKKVPSVEVLHWKKSNYNNGERNHHSDETFPQIVGLHILLEAKVYIKMRVNIIFSPSAAEGVRQAAAVGGWWVVGKKGKQGLQRRVDYGQCPSGGLKWADWLTRTGGSLPVAMSHLLL